MLTIQNNNVYYQLNANSSRGSNDKSIVVTKTKKGKPLSYFEDNLWIFTFEVPLSSRVKELYFDESFFPNHDFFNEVKRIILLHLSRPKKHQRNRTISSSSQLLTIMKELGLFIKMNSNPIYRFKDLFIRDQLIYQFISQIKSRSKVEHLKALIGFLNSISSAQRGFKAIGQTVLQNIDEKLKQLPSTRQHYVIPEQIYNNLISNMIKDIDDIHSNMKRIETLLTRTFTQTGYFMSIKRQKELFGKKYLFLPEPSEALTETGLEVLSEKHNIRTFENLNSFVGAVQGLCKTLVLSQSGMRSDDFNSINYGKNGVCIDYQTYNNKKIPILWGYSKKLMGETTKVPWVIGQDAIKAIEILQMIARVVFQASREKKHLISESLSDLEDIPLGVNSLALKGFVTGAMKKNRNAVFFNEKPHQNKFIRDYDLYISIDDIEELSHYNPNYDSKVITEGKKWKLKYHQLRRTLAVLAVESGVVHKTSLMRQFKHLSLVLSEYYSQNARTNPFFNGHNDTSISGVKTELQVSGIIALLNNNEVIGGQGISMLHEIWLDFKAGDQSFRKKLERKVKNGEAAYSSSPCGGCLSRTNCDHKIQGQYIPCLTCTEALHSPAQLNALLEVLYEQYESIPKKDIGRTYVQDEIDSVKRAIKKLNKEQK